MEHSQHHPPFGAADLSNCERELIHLAGSVQPHGALLVLRESDFVVLQATANTRDVVGVPYELVLSQPIGALGGDIAEQVTRTARSNLLTVPAPIRCRVRAGDEMRALQGMMHRQLHSGFVVELEPMADEVDVEESLPHALTTAVARVTSATTIASLADEVVRYVRDLTHYDRVMVYRFDVDGHGEVIAEARDERLEPFLGQHYPASDIPQRARELYLRNRVRVLVDVHYTPVAIVPRHSPQTGEELDMSLSYLRSMSPLHLQYLQNMGVTATLVTSLVREGRLWGLIACHHYSTKSVTYETRAAAELLSEVVSTRISALENRALVEAELFVRSLEHQLVAAATESGDWRDALFDDPEGRLLRPLNASGAALFYEGEIVTAGETPSRPELRALLSWIGEQPRQPVTQTSALPKLNPELASLAPTATGVLAIELSYGDGDYLMWFRKEQVRTVTWAGNPEKPVVVGNDPRDLSPRRSFAAWSELVRETATPWSPAELAMAAAVRTSLVDMILQLRALRALIAERHASTTLTVIERADEPVILAGAAGQILMVNDAFHRLVERPLSHLRTLDDLKLVASDRRRMREMLDRLTTDRQPWRGELWLGGRGDQAGTPVAVRADPVPGLRGDTLGYIIMFTDLRQQREANVIRARLERTIAESHIDPPLGGVAAMLSKDFDTLLHAVLANASAAIMQISESSAEASARTLLVELEAATRRAADLTAQILGTVSKSQQQS